jgi:glyoxylase-like metal-dependent hydrolase (beta-lactamase superfamily II)
MYRSLAKLKALPDDTLLLPGHNYSDVPSATMGETKKKNTYLNINEIELWHQLMGD